MANQISKKWHVIYAAIFISQALSLFLIWFKKIIDVFIINNNLDKNQIDILKGIEIPTSLLFIIIMFFVLTIITYYKYVSNGITNDCTTNNNEIGLGTKTNLVIKKYEKHEKHE